MNNKVLKMTKSKMGLFFKGSELLLNSVNSFYAEVLVN